MNVQLLLDKPRNHFTNLDLITGKVVLRTRSQEDVDNITVKLEGESRTRLMAQGPPTQRHERPRPVLEVHKMLYKVYEVWPQQQLGGRDTQNFVTLAPGLYEYPFSFKIPFNNACSSINSFKTNTGFMGLSLEIAQNPKQHIKTTLPPTLYFPGEAEIRYFIKVTVRRHSFFKENARAVVPFNFFPIEPPRPLTDGETYARRQHQFQTRSVSVSPNPGEEGKRRSFAKVFEKSPVTPTEPLSPDFNSATPPRFGVDARLPNPAVVTCNNDLPLRLLVKKLSDSKEPLYLQTLQIELIGYTLVRAHEVQRKKSSSWVIVSLANVGQMIGSKTDAVGTETELDADMWRGKILPNTVAPTFTTCNIRREYELLVTVGLAYGSETGSHSQFAALPLRLPLSIFSGIKPPVALLEAMRLPPEKMSTPPSAPNQDAPSPAYEPTPMAPGQSYVATAPAGASSTPQSIQPSVVPPNYSDAPPSYEDAVTGDLPPVDEPRPDYEPPPAPEGEGDLTGRDEKRRLPF